MWSWSSRTNICILSEADAKHGITRNSVWLDVSDAIYAKRAQFHGRYVIVEGTFNARRRGHLGMSSGEIEILSDSTSPTDSESRSATGRRTGSCQPTPRERRDESEPRSRPWILDEPSLTNSVDAATSGLTGYDGQLRTRRLTSRTSSTSSSHGENVESPTCSRTRSTAATPRPPCGGNELYVRKHNPFISYANVQRDPTRVAKIVDCMSSRPTSLAAGRRLQLDQSRSVS